MSFTPLCRLAFNARWPTEATHAHIRELTGPCKIISRRPIQLICATTLSLSAISCGVGGSEGGSPPTPVAPPMQQLPRHLAQ